ncbi:hypothetical protein CONPUDRAFT_158248 [Coniophora puteana RWD-64-598 SS2]|uniref:non-specific serine/threonine protein kinase n=1 Tax=Coniophora puteana (strain RWD-64-598) TaxID=741705 RepID=A0A5M3MBM4_CONPW|nr:uncharacterized protein CONPUDRAFT_158248 [Coniophora puteana RWD-64-598 SS2]EIW76220.1 hypothetical protein CONPUDRAFT_158248 [Coniophora puteana RWD-64-598 SS2]
MSPKVRRRSFELISAALHNQSQEKAIPELSQVADILLKGISDKDRSVRLSAGSSVVEFIKLHEVLGETRGVEAVLAIIRRILESSAKAALKETTLILAGSIAKVAKSETLGQALLCLITQLGDDNPTLKGIAYVKLLEVAKARNTTSYSLFSPYLSRIAPYIVSRICMKPTMIIETSRFLMIRHQDFLNLTLPFTLPQLFASCDFRAIEQVADEVGIKQSKLFLDHSHIVLANVFQLQGPGQPAKSLNFIVNALMKDSAPNSKASIDVQSITQICIVPLLAELVIFLGDTGVNDAVALQALKRIDRLLNISTEERPSASQPNIADLLHSYMLGVLSHLNDMLQDFKGKKSVENKCQMIRGLGEFVKHIGPPVHGIAPQVMATLQTMLLVPELAEATLSSWFIFLSTLSEKDVAPYLGPSSASLLCSWPVLTSSGRQAAFKCLEFIVTNDDVLLDEIVDMSSIPDLQEVSQRLLSSRRAWGSRTKLEKILDRSTSDNYAVTMQALRELKSFMLNSNDAFVRTLTSGDIFDPLASRIFSVLLAAACRDGHHESLRLMAFECMGILGALDPDRCEIGVSESAMIVRTNFNDEAESVLFAIHLLKDVLVGAFRSTTDIKYQGHLAFTIQELLRFCNFTPDLVVTGKTTSIPSKVRNRWASLPKYVIETVAPLLGARFNAPRKPLAALNHPIYKHEKTYREWLQQWTAYLITKASGKTAKTIFGNFHSAIRNKDVGVAHHILPHLVLNILLSGHEDDAQAILKELLVVLEDQVDPASLSSNDKKFLSAQVVFMLLDHISKYVRILRQDIANRKSDNKRTRAQQMAVEGEDLLIRLDSVTSNINHELMAKAALQCQAYERALMHFEQQITVIRERQEGAQKKDLTPYYDKLHEIYAQLDEPDGMEGISTLILSPSLEHQIRQHESTGHWTSAQSCWEVRLQQDPDNLDFHLGLLRCLRNLGHYDTLRTHVQGVLVRNPDWNDALAGYQAESAWMIGAWDDVERIVKSTSNRNSSLVKADVLLAVRSGNATRVEEVLSSARSVIGSSITTSGVKGYRRSYDALLDLHLIHEVELIRDHVFNLPVNSQERRTQLRSLGDSLDARLDKTIPSYRTRETILSMRRTAFSLSAIPQPSVAIEVGRSWLASAKIARKTGQWQTAYSAMLQSQQTQLKFSFMESAKLVKAAGEPLRALQELENSMRLAGILESKSDTIDLTNDTDASKKMVAKAYVLLARWMNESDRFEATDVLNTFGEATKLSPAWESAHFYLGQFHDQCYKMLPSQDLGDRGVRMNLHTIRNFAKAIIHGSKYVYQTVPRLLTLWLDMGEHQEIRTSPAFTKVNGAVSTAVDNIPVYKWFTAFPQIVSRVGHDNVKVYQILAKLIAKVIKAYPHQALWLFTSVVKSTKSAREERGRHILEKLKNDIAHAGTPLPGLIQECGKMTDELLRMCNYPINDERKVLSMKKSFPALARLGHSPLIIPLQESLTPNVPVSSSSGNDYNPFPFDAPTFHEFFDDIEVMHSLAKPRKITIRGSDGQIYMFLGKPKDDLRKDARLMDFNAIINKLLKANSESRRRQLRIRTYGVVTLNEECGFIQWVPNTIPVRPVLLKGYESRRISSWNGELSAVFRRIKEVPDKEAAVLYQTKVLTQFPPVFHEWFIETFPEPSAWLASRLSYGRTAAVMSMVGFILGLGDRHCENILLDVNTGDVVHVDFNCLFEKGKTLETPERVPFRLTQNLVDGLGVTGVEGVFRIACEVTMRLLRDNKDSLMSVLDAFIHDPLVEWEDEKRKMERDGAKRNVVRSTTDLRHLAKNALNPIEKKLRGVYVARSNKERIEKEMSVGNLVQVLIQESTDPANLAKMYPGWCSWH